MFHTPCHYILNHIIITIVIFMLNYSLIKRNIITSMGSKQIPKHQFPPRKTYVSESVWAPLSLRLLIVISLFGRSPGALGLLGAWGLIGPWASLDLGPDKALGLALAIRGPKAS